MSLADDRSNGDDGDDGDDGLTRFVARHAAIIKDRYFDDLFWSLDELETEFATIFVGIVSLYLTNYQRQVALEALLACFKRLDIAFVRRACLKLASVGCWASLSDTRQRYEFEQQPRLLQLWSRVKDFPENQFFGQLIDDCVESGDEGMVNLIIFCLLQWPTRRYLLVLLDDKCFVARCRVKGYRFVDQLQHIINGSTFQDPSADSSAWSRDDLLEDLYCSVEEFQLAVYSVDPTNPLASTPLYSLCDHTKCKALLQTHLTNEIVEHWCKQQSWERECFVERLCESFCFNDFEAKSRIIKDPLPNLLSIKSLDTLKAQLLPLTLQFLNQEDYLVRFYNLLKYEFTKGLAEQLKTSLKRCKPVLDSKGGVVFDGWSRYCAPCQHMSTSVYQISLSPSTTEAVLSEWERLKIGDALYLCKVAQLGGQFSFDQVEPVSIIGYVREQHQHQHQHQTITDDSTKSTRKILLSLDTPEKDINFVVRLDPKDNSLALLTAIKDIIHSSKARPLIDHNLFYFGHQVEGVKQVTNVADWINTSSSSSNTLLVCGPSSSGKTSCLIDVLQIARGKKAIILVPTAESADFLTHRLVKGGLVEESLFVRLGHSPQSLVHGKVQWFLDYRRSLLMEAEKYLDEFGNDIALTSSCEAVLSGLERMDIKDDKGLALMCKIKNILPLEFIQGDEHRESYLLKHHSEIALMTFGFAALNRQLLNDLSVDFVLMEDCHLVAELFSMLALFADGDDSHQPKVILFGNPHLEPVVDELLLTEYNYGHSLFKRLFRLQCSTMNLSTIFNVPKQCSHLFEQHCLHSDCIVESIAIDCDNIHDAFECRQNVAEAEALVEHYLQLSLPPSDSVAILAPFNSQIDLLWDVFKANNAPTAPSIYTIDKFTGAHADVVLCSMTVPRMTPFLKKRMSSLFTRATKKLIIFHSSQFNPLLLQIE